MVRRIFSTLIAAGFWFVVVCVLWVLALRVIPPPVTWLMAARSSETGGIERTWTPLTATASAMPLAVIASEDQRFTIHHGFDWKAMREAMEYNERKKGKKVKGASTISQQTAKNVFCWPGRTFLRKGVEAWFTLLMEGLWSKERVIEVYLNIAETGPRHFGVAAIANSCWSSRPAKLSVAQCALIAAVLPKPRKFNACAPSGYIRRRQGAIQAQMRALGDVFDPAIQQHMREQDEKAEARIKRRARR